MTGPNPDSRTPMPSSITHSKIWQLQANGQAGIIREGPGAGAANCGPRRGSTRTELLVVIAIIAILIGLLLPAIQRIRESVNRIKCANNLKQIGLGCHNYEADYGTFPEGQREVGRIQWPYFLHTLLPYLEQTGLSDA